MSQKSGGHVPKVNNLAFSENACCAGVELTFQRNGSACLANLRNQHTLAGSRMSFIKAPHGFR